MTEQFVLANDRLNEVTPADFPTYAPGNIWLDTTQRQSDAITARGISFPSHHVDVPGHIRPSAFAIPKPTDGDSPARRANRFRIMVGCGLVMLALAWIGSYLNVKGRSPTKPPPALDDLPQLSSALHCDTDGLVHSGGGSLTLGGLRGVLRTADAMTPCLTAGGGDIALGLLRRLCFHILLRHLLYLPAPVGRARGQPTPSLGHHVAGE